MEIRIKGTGTKGGQQSLGLFFAIYVYAFYISLAGRPIFGKRILPE